MKVVVDAFGGDNAPLEVVEGAVLAVKKRKDLERKFFMYSKLRNEKNEKKKYWKN